MNRIVVQVLATTGFLVIYCLSPQHVSASDNSKVPSCPSWRVMQTVMGLGMPEIVATDEKTIAARQAQKQHSDYLEETTSERRAKFSIAHQAWLSELEIKFGIAQYNKVKNRKQSFETWIKEETAAERFNNICPTPFYKQEEEFCTSWWYETYWVFAQKFPKSRSGVNEQRDNWIRDCLVDNYRLHCEMTKGKITWAKTVYRNKLQEDCLRDKL